MYQYTDRYIGTDHLTSLSFINQFLVSLLSDYPLIIYRFIAFLVSASAAEQHTGFPPKVGEPRSHGLSISSCE